MTEILNAALTVRVVLVAALVFGFAPGLVIRVITLAWPRDHPRRLELRAELGAVEYWKRPIWVAEQLETALVDGIGARFGVYRAAVNDVARGVRDSLAALDVIIREQMGLHRSEVQVNAFVLRRRLRSPFRRQFVRLASASPAGSVPTVRWTKDKGLMGRCRFEHRVVASNRQTSAFFLGLDPDTWASAPCQVRMALTLREAQNFCDESTSCVVVAVFDRQSRLRGCISVDLLGGREDKVFLVPYVIDMAVMAADTLGVFLWS